jgi:hypothetical protein
VNFACAIIAHNQMMVQHLLIQNKCLKLPLDLCLLLTMFASRKTQTAPRSMYNNLRICSQCSSKLRDSTLPVYKTGYVYELGNNLQSFRQQKKNGIQKEHCLHQQLLTTQLQNCREKLDNNTLNASVLSVPAKPKTGIQKDHCLHEQLPTTQLWNCRENSTTALIASVLSVPATPQN